jgi:hypothetical protein
MDIEDIIAITNIVAIAGADFEGDPDLDSRERSRAMQQRHVQIVLRLQDLVIRALEEMEQKIAEGKPLNLTAGECKALLDVGRKLAPWVMGDQMPTLLDPSSKKPN